MDPISQPKTLLAGLGPDLPWYLCYPLWMLHKRGIRAALRSGDWPLPPRWLAEIDYASHSLLFLGLLCVACLKCENRRLASPRTRANAWPHARFGLSPTGPMTASLGQIT